MKKVLSVCAALSIASVVFGEENSSAEPFKFGVGGLVGVDRIGASAQMWINEKIGNGGRNVFTESCA